MKNRIVVIINRYLNIINYLVFIQINRNKYFLIMSALSLILINFSTIEAPLLHIHFQFELVSKFYFKAIIT